MDIRGRSVLILGGYGLVGQAVARRLLRESPRRLTLLSLARQEAEEAVAALETERGDVEVKPAWGDLFTFADWKDEPRDQVYGDPVRRRRFIESLVGPLTEAAAAEYFIYQLVTKERPDIIVDAVNTATGIAYQDIYKTGRLAWDALQKGPTSARAWRRCS